MTDFNRGRMLDLLTYHTLGAFEGLCSLINIISDETLKKELLAVQKEYLKQRAEIDRRADQIKEDQ